MKIDPRQYHQLYGARQKRSAYFKKDFLDYLAMLVITGVVVAFSYGPDHIVAKIGIVICLLMLVTFTIRHGVELRTPLILRRPQDLLYMLIYKIRNIRPVYLLAVSVLAVENILIYLTPSLPHHADLMRTIALWLFFLHLIALTLYRTVSLVAHLRKTELIREVLSQTSWKKQINEKTNIHLEICHAYLTGLLAHIVLVAPWFLVINYLSFSVIFLPLVLVINHFTEMKWVQTYNEWFYRDHWLSHNSELDFVYLHGAHHDAIPSGLIGVAGNGFLEGFLRFSLGAPVPFYNPLFSCITYSIGIKVDIDMHQYIPGIFPKLTRDDLLVLQHSTHHFGQLEPYSFGARFDLPEVSDAYKEKFKGIPEEIRNSIHLDEELTGFKWDNPTYRQTLKLFEKYHNS